MGRGRKTKTRGRGQTRNNTQMRMHGWDDAYEADLSHRCNVKPPCINERRAVCSVLRVVHVHVRDGVLVVHCIVLKRDVVMREGIRNVVAIRSHFCIVNCS